MSERTATPRRTPGNQPARRSLTDRLQDTLSSAAEEHRANAAPSSARGNRARRAPALDSPGTPRAPPGVRPAASPGAPGCA